MQEENAGEKMGMGHLSRISCVKLGICFQGQSYTHLYPVTFLTNKLLSVET
jgi:hypothetical protein